MDIHQFKTKLMFCKTKEEEQALYKQNPDLAREHEARMQEIRNKRPYNLPPLPEPRVPKKVDVEGTLPLGSIIEKEGRQYKITKHFTITVEDSLFLAVEQDVIIDPGTYSLGELI